MTYREILEQYRNGTLEASERERVAQDIERQEAIGDYLLEQEEIPELQSLLAAEDAQQEKEDGAQQEEFVRLVNRSIRRAFRRVGAVVLAVAIVLTLFIQTALPRLAAKFYYQPDRPVGETSNQMSLDMAVFTELFCPCEFKDYVVAENRGYGVYDVDIRKLAMYSWEKSVAGVVTRGNLRLYDGNQLKAPSDNMFAWLQAGGDLTKPLTELVDETGEMAVWKSDKETADGGSFFVWAGGSRETAREMLLEQGEHGQFVGYVTLNQMMDYESFRAYLTPMEDSLFSMWCAVKTADSWDGRFHPKMIGFRMESESSNDFAWDEEAYPGLMLGTRGNGTWESQEKQERTEEFMKKHISSLFRYQADHGEILEMMKTAADDVSEQELREMADYVEENGVTVYGFAAVMDRETALELLEDEEVYGIVAEPLP